MTVIGKTLLLTTALSLPGIASAGGYGTAGVSDASVGQTASAGETVYCRNLNTEVPRQLYVEMDCGDGVLTGFATPQVAPERFTDEPEETGFFGLPPHVRSGPTPNDDNDRPRLIDNERPDPDDNGTPTVPVDKEPEPETGPIGKWERLNELGINRDNFGDQGPGFVQDIRDYRESNPGGDWSGFRR